MKERAAQAALGTPGGQEGCRKQQPLTRSVPTNQSASDGEMASHRAKRGWEVEGSDRVLLALYPAAKCTVGVLPA